MRPDLDLAPRGRRQHDVQQAPLDRRADEDLQARALRSGMSLGGSTQTVVSLVAEPLAVAKTGMP